MYVNEILVLPRQFGKKKKKKRAKIVQYVKKIFGLTLCYYDNGKTTNQHYFRLPQHNTSAQ